MHPSINNHSSSSSSASSTYHPSSSTADFGNQSFTSEHYRSASGPASTPSSRSYNGPSSAAPYSSGHSSQALSPSQHYFQQQPPYPTTAITPSHPPPVDPQNPSMSQSPMHHGYSSSAPGSAPFHHHQQQQQQSHPQYIPSGAPGTTSAPYQSHHSHYNPSSYPSTSPSFSDHQEYNPQLNPFEVKHCRRTTRSQFKLLESTFRDNPQPNATTRKEISEQLDMPIRAVQIWFQNRRAKANKAKAVTKRSDSGRSIQSADGSSLHESDADISRGNLSMDARSISFDNEEDAMYQSSHPHPNHNHNHTHNHTHSRSYSSNHDFNGSANLSSSSSGSGFNSIPPPPPPSSSSQQSHQSNSFKMPLRPSRLEFDPPSRRVLINPSMPTSASSSSFVYHSPTFASHSNSTPSSASYDETSFSHRPLTSSSAPFDDRYRGSRGPLASPSVFSRESSSSMQFDRSGPYSQTSTNTSVTYDAEGRRLSLPDNSPYPASANHAANTSNGQEYHQSNHRSQYTEANYNHHPQHSYSSHSQSHPQGDYWRY